MKHIRVITAFVLIFGIPLIGWNLWKVQHPIPYFASASGFFTSGVAFYPQCIVYPGRATTAIVLVDGKYPPTITCGQCTITSADVGAVFQVCEALP